MKDTNKESDKEPVDFYMARIEALSTLIKVQAATIEKMWDEIEQLKKQ